MATSTVKCCCDDLSRHISVQHGGLLTPADELREVAQAPEFFIKFGFFATMPIPHSSMN